MVNPFVGQGIARAQAGLRAEEREERQLGQRDTALALQERGVGVSERDVGLREEQFEGTRSQKIRTANQNAFDKMTGLIALMNQLSESNPDVKRLLPALQSRRDNLAKSLKISRDASRAEVLEAEQALIKSFTLSKDQTRFEDVPGGEPIEVATGIETPAALPNVVTIQMPDGTISQVPENQVPAGAVRVTLPAGTGIQDGQAQPLIDDPVRSIGAVIAPIIAKIAAGEKVTPGERKALAEAKATGLLGQIAAGQGVSTAELLAGDVGGLTPDEQAAVNSAEAANMTQEQFTEFAKNSTKSPESLKKIAEALGFTFDGE